MVYFVLGVAVAFAAAISYSVGVSLQSLEAREVPTSESLRLSLLRRLVTRRRWVVGTSA